MQVNKLTSILALVCCLGFGAAPAVNAADQFLATQRLERLLADPELKQQAYAAGEERISFCGYCHGRDGNSKRSDIPNLAEQNPVYLFNAFEKFATGERTDFVMSKLAKKLTEEERINIALYYGLQKVIKKETDNPELFAVGEKKYREQCYACHGKTGLGELDAPRLAGQPAEYIRHSLTLFRDNDPMRAGSQMIGIAAKLSEADIDALASYLQGLNP